MKLIALGTTGYHPNDQRQTACYMIPEIGLVLDAGTGAYRIRKHLQGDSLDIYLSHAHLDHVMGITFLFDVLYERDVSVARVHGVAEKLAAIQDHLFASDLFPILPPIEWHPLDASQKVGGRGELTTFPLEHPGGSVGFRIDWPDYSMAYVTDTMADVGADYVAKLSGVDLLLHECYFRDEYRDFAVRSGHSWTTPVCEVARAAKVGRLVLIHINPLDESDDPVDLSKAREIFPATDVAFDGMEIDLPIV
jgi:ribonuclease BN (tRNA processing enzyme)